jgi:hypothetical protein
MTITDVEKKEQFNNGLNIGVIAGILLVIMILISIISISGFHKNSVVSTPDGLGVVKSNKMGIVYEIWNIDKKITKKYVGSEVESYRIGQEK